MTNSILVTWLVAVAVPLTPEPPPPSPVRCELVVKAALESARRKGYEFRAEAVGVPTTCLIVDDTLVVSAKTGSDGACRFELFVPPLAAVPDSPAIPAAAKPVASRKPQVLLRIAIKPADGGEEKWEQRKEDSLAGFTVERTATKAQSVNFRISRVEIAPVDGGCDPAKLEAKL